MIKEVVLALVLAALFTVLGAIAEYKYHLIEDWNETRELAYK